MTTDSYATVMSTWPYRPETDWVVESPTGEMAASALGWLDDENKVGLVEPVGCVPEHRRRGLGVAVNIALLNAFRQQGATIAVVLPRGDEGYPGPGELYRKVGFKPGGRTFTYVRSHICSQHWHAEMPAGPGGLWGWAVIGARSLRWWWRSRSSPSDGRWCDACRRAAPR